MKLAQLTHHYWPERGGVQHFVQEVSERLVADHGHQVEVWTTRPPTAPPGGAGATRPPRREGHHGVDIRRYRATVRGTRALTLARDAARRRRWPIWKTINSWRVGPRSPGLFACAVLRDADVICASPFPYAHMEWVLHRPARRRVPIVYYGALHNGRDPVWPHAAAAIARCDAYLAHTGAERDAVAATGFPAERIVVIPPGVDLGAFVSTPASSARTTLGLPERPTVAYVGRMAAYKGIDTLIAAMERLWEDGADVTLLVAGQAGDFTPSVEAARTRNGDRLQVIASFPSDVRPTIYQAADIVVSTSTEESYGMTFIEAWAASRPVVGARSPAVEDVIRDGVDGLLVDARDQRALAEAIDRLLADPARRAEMGLAGREATVARNDWRVVAQQWATLLDGLVP